jgi:hypothetical protein
MVLASLAVVMALSLHDFFNHYKAEPHQIAAIQELQEAMPAELLDRKASWYETWKAGGRIEWLLVPYYNQYKLQNGSRKCFTAAAAMIAGNYARVLDPHNYDRVRAKYGDTTQVYTHLNALWELKLKARFFNNATPHLVEQLIDLGVPVGVGWLQNGNVAAGERPTGGHWSVIIGYTKSFFIVHDPAGQPDLARGGHDISKTGEGVHYDKRYFIPRWEVEGAGSGWALVVTEDWMEDDIRSIINGHK